MRPRRSTYNQDHSRAAKIYAHPSGSLNLLWFLLNLSRMTSLSTSSCHETALTDFMPKIPVPVNLYVSDAHPVIAESIGRPERDPLSSWCIMQPQLQQETYANFSCVLIRWVTWLLCGSDNHNKIDPNFTSHLHRFAAEALPISFRPLFTSTCLLCPPLGHLSPRCHLHLPSELRSISRTGTNGTPEIAGILFK